MNNRKALFLAMAAAALLACGKEPQSTIPLPDIGDNGDETTDMTSLTVYGKVLDEQGKPYPGVVVTDGYNFAQTGEDGSYRFEKYRYASFVQCSIPSDAVIVTGGTYNLPEGHYKRLQSTVKEYNFTYTRQEPETRFRILALGDPQVQNDKEVERYRQTARADIRQYVVDAEKMPTYGITLGDNVENKWDYLPRIGEVLGQMSIPVFATIGNHDHEYPVENEAASRKKYEQVFGPSNFSFNRGKVHFVVFDNVLHSGKSSSEYTEGYEPWQLEWLRKDLSFVPKDMRIVMTVHIPLTDKTVMELLTPFASALVLCGHTHKVENSYDKTIGGKKITICAAGSTGAPWKGLILSDGCQRGYKVYEFEGNAISREIYKSIQYAEPFQIRMYRTDDFPAFTTPVGNLYNFSYYGSDYIAVNVFNYKDGWKVSLFEDGVLTSSSPLVKSSYDMWAKMFLYRNYNRDNTIGKSGHIMYFKLRNPSAAVRVEATDEFGVTFSCDRFTTSADIPDYND